MTVCYISLKVKNIIKYFVSLVLNVLENDTYLNHVHSRGDEIMGVHYKPPIETAPLEYRVNEYANYDKHLML